ncbi:hypothetical protein LTR66_011365 [Elasticomyces elasticus]|nr:hypothetical protein LTR66_011365 [Elasticomyces elasticus]
MMQSTISPSEKVNTELSDLGHAPTHKESSEAHEDTPTTIFTNTTAGIGDDGNVLPVTHTYSKALRREDGKIELCEDDCYKELGFCFPEWKKWSILTVIFIVQTSMNFNASIFANAISPMAEEFNVPVETARHGQMVFLIAYAFGCELWAPWSEELGRWSILQLSLFLVNVWQIPCALAQNPSTMLAGRFLGGLSSAGGSVTLGMVADMWEPNDQQFAVSYVVLSSVGGSVVAPIVGGFIQQYLHWRWVFWIQLIFGVFAQLLHYFACSETRSSVLLDRIAKGRRKAANGRGDDANVYGPNEIKGSLRHRLSFKEIVEIWTRPFIMFVKEPIVLCLSLLSGFSDALIFTFLESYKPVFSQWNFGTIALGLAFIPLPVGYVIAYFSFMPFFRRDRRARQLKGADAVPPERRLYWLLYTAPLLTLGLLGFAWTSVGPPRVHWIAPLVFSALVGIANYAIYMATVDYMVAAYGPYASSATGGNGMARDFLAGIAALYASPFYTNLPAPYTLEYPTTILACLAFVLTLPIYVFYWKGAWFRERSKFALNIAASRMENEGRRTSNVSLARDVRKSQKESSSRQGSRRSSPARQRTPAGSRRPSLV